MGIKVRTDLGPRVRAAQNAARVAATACEGDDVSRAAKAFVDFYEHVFALAAACLVAKALGGRDASAERALDSLGREKDRLVAALEKMGATVSIAKTSKGSRVRIAWDDGAEEGEVRA